MDKVNKENNRLAGFESLFAIFKDDNLSEGWSPMVISTAVFESSSIFDTWEADIRPSKMIKNRYGLTVANFCETVEK